MPWPSDWPPGVSAPVGPARRTRCRRAPASSGTPARVTASRPASRCSRCSPTTSTASSARSPHSTAATTSRRTGRRTPAARWSSTGSVERVESGVLTHESGLVTVHSPDSTVRTPDSTVRTPDSTLQQQDDRLGDAGGLVLALDLDRVADGGLLALGQVGDVGDRDVRADPLADEHRVGEADLVGAVVELGAGRLEGQHLAAQEGHQGEREVAVGDGAPERAVLGAVDVDVDPLVVTGGLREDVDALLVDRQPIGGAELLTGGGGHFVESLEDAHA